MQKLAEICVKRPIFASVLILILVVLGFVGFTRLGVDRYPEVDFPTVTVVTTQPGASPEAVETEITKEIEDAVGTLSGIDTITSNSTEGSSNVTVTFVLEKDTDIATQEVRDKVALIQRELPEDIDPPTVRRFDPASQPIIVFAVTADRPVREITEYADKVLRRRIESADGVGEVSVRGGRARQINVYLDAYKMRSLGVTVPQVTAALQSQNVDIPGGRVEQPGRTLTLRTLGKLKNVSDFNNIVLSAEGGSQVLLQDVARVVDDVADADSYAEINGRTTVSLAVLKQSGTNTLAVIDAVKERVEEVKAELPEGYSIRAAQDQSGYIEAAIHSVEEHLIVGSILASLVVLVFLWNWRSTLISAVSIPASIIATFFLMYAMGFTLNVITLLALTLAVGIVIDDAIVVLENIYRNIEEKGLDPYTASIEAPKEIGLAVLATTLSLIAVFLPVAFMSGIVGRFMNSFGLTMAFAILVSLIVSFSLTPAMSARMLKSPHGAGATGAVASGEGSPHNGAHNSAAENVVAHAAGHAMPHSDTDSKERGFYALIDRTYTAMLKWSMAHRWVIVLACLATLAMPVFLVRSGSLAFNFLPEDDESKYQVSIELPQGTSLEATRNVSREIDKALRADKTTDYTYLSVGRGGNLNEASIFVNMVPLEKREISQQEMVQVVRRKVLKPFSDRGVLQYILTGPDLAKMTKSADAVVAQLQSFPGVVDADTSLVVGKPELQATINRPLAAQLGVNVQQVAGALRILVGGDKVTDFEQGGEQYDVFVRAEQKFRTQEEGLALLTVPSSTVGTVGLDQVVTFTNNTGPAVIERLNRQRQIAISANTIPGANEAGIGARVRELVAAQKLGPEYSVTASGTAKEQARSGAAFIAAFGMSFVFMYLILAAQFESWVHPITILLALPLTIPFALLSIVIFGQTINIFSMLGILVLFGVVKKNGILQVDHMNQLREGGMNRYDAIIQGNRDRLRPILMTTIAFVAGMLPLVISNGIGAGTNRAIGTVIFGGQTMSLLLTLLATPVIYSLFDDLTSWLARTRNRVFNRGKAPARSANTPVQAAVSEKG
jgi:HAE1 family hydrophobic/amphiphilic exporter-1